MFVCVVVCVCCLSVVVCCCLICVVCACMCLCAGDSLPVFGCLFCLGVVFVWLFFGCFCLTYVCVLFGVLVCVVV